MAVVELENLSHEYRSGFWKQGRVRALDSVTLAVEPGEVFGLLGANGAGKTTTFRILTGLLRPTGGSARIFGEPPGSLRARGRIGYLPEVPGLYDYLTGREFLIYCGRLFSLSPADSARRADHLMEMVGLPQRSGLRLRNYSKGMRQRLSLAQALVNDPELLLLDEPMSGLDPLGRRAVRDLIGEQRRRGRTIVFSSHILSDVESLCDRVAILGRGRLLESGSLQSILGPLSGEMEAVVYGIAPEALAEIGSFALEVVPTPGGARVRLAGDGDLPRLVETAHRFSGRLVSATSIRDSLEDIFIREVAPADRSGYNSADDS